jgi:hypothetical protein
MNINGIEVEVTHDYLEFARRVLADAIDSTNAPSEDSAADASLIDLLRAANSYWDDYDPEVIGDRIAANSGGIVSEFEITAHVCAYGVGQVYNDENDLPTLLLAAAHKILESAQ